MIAASDLQIAVLLEDAADAQDVFDVACPGVFDVVTPDRSLRAYAADPTVPAWAVGQGRVDQVDYALLATLALTAGINHLAVGVWIAGTPETYQAAEPAGTLWEALDLVPVEEPI
jgi:hypothetical protein